MAHRCVAERTREEGTPPTATAALVAKVAEQEALIATLQIENVQLQEHNAVQAAQIMQLQTQAKLFEDTVAQLTQQAAENEKNHREWESAQLRPAHLVGGRLRHPPRAPAVAVPLMRVGFEHPVTYEYGSLRKAAQESREVDVRQFLDLGISPNATRECLAGWGPLHYAAAAGFLGIVKLLCEPEYAVDVGAVDADGTTPTMQAECRGHTDVVAFLIERTEYQWRQQRGYNLTSNQAA